MSAIGILNAGSGTHDFGDLKIDRMDCWKEFGTLRNKKPPSDFVSCDLAFVPLADESVLRMVFCFHVLEHTKNPYIVLCEFHRIMSDSAILCLGMPNSRLVTSEHPTHLYSWTPDSITNLLNLVGFDVVRMETEISGMNMTLIARKKKE